MNVPEDLSEWRQDAEDLPDGECRYSERTVALIDALIAARKVLADIDWKCDSPREDPWCPSCHGYIGDGHAPNCALAAVLRGNDG